MLTTSASHGFSTLLGAAVTKGGSKAESGSIPPCALLEEPLSALQLLSLLPHSGRQISPPNTGWGAQQRWQQMLRPWFLWLSS